MTDRDRLRRVIASIGRDNPYRDFPDFPPAKHRLTRPVINAAIDAVEEAMFNLEVAKGDFQRARWALVAATSAAAKAMIALAVLKGREYFGRL